ncbi:DUF3667 domain-containing protein [Glycocaulis sp.]|uniref:DUF3667 domain-containing protein n=1 Tax=Glycocaulis sp. TaxID=1969725 RepID=UPI003D20730D
MSETLGEAADTAIEHAQADALGGLGADRGDGGSDGICRNCGAELTGEFCHSCGQSARSLRRPFWTLVKESVETLFVMDGRLAQTLPALMVYPGRVSRDYLDGRRARFIPPFRLYVFASLIFFVLLPLTLGQGIGFDPSMGGIDTAREQLEQARDRGEMSEEEYQDAVEGLGLAESILRGGVPQAPSQDAPDRNGSAPATTGMPPEAVEALRQAGRTGNLDATGLGFVRDNASNLWAETRRWVPRIMFVLLPVYAALLALVYLWRRRFLYFDHLIVSLHFHAALFLAMTVTVLASMVIGWGWATLGLLIYANAYLYRINRVVYGRGRFSSVVRTLVLDTLYFFFLMTGLLMAVIFGAMSLAN